MQGEKGNYLLLFHHLPAKGRRGGKCCPQAASLTIKYNEIQNVLFLDGTSAPQDCRRATLSRKLRLGY